RYFGNGSQDLRPARPTGTWDGATGNADPAQQSCCEPGFGQLRPIRRHVGSVPTVPPGDSEHRLVRVIHCRTAQLPAFCQVETAPTENGGRVGPHDEITDRPLVYIDARELGGMLQQVGKKQASLCRTKAYNLTSVHTDKEDLAARAGMRIDKRPHRWRHH